MSFAFYPKHEHACPNVGHCPHLGGASLGSLVQVANYSSQSHENDQRQIRVLREDRDDLLSQVVALEEQLAAVKLELKLERQNKFATNQQKDAAAEPAAAAQPPTEEANEALRLVILAGFAQLRRNMIGTSMCALHRVAPIVKARRLSTQHSVRPSICKKTSSTASIVSYSTVIQSVAAVLVIVRYSKLARARFLAVALALACVPKQFTCAM